MTEYRFKSQDREQLASTTQVIEVARDWSLSLNGQAPVDKHGRALSILVEHGDQWVIGVKLGDTPLSSFSAVLTDPLGNSVSLSDAWTTDGQTATAESDGEKKVVNVKIRSENDLPDDG